ncbi:8986_t:CDS:1, partial [Ambispora leptoticha]
ENGQPKSAAKIRKQQFNVEEIDEDLRKRVIATLYANTVKTTPNEDETTCFARAKTLEDTIYKIT